MQIASEKMAFIFDLIKLHKEVPDILDDCLSRILLSPRVLKLGMKILVISLCIYWQKIFLVDKASLNSKFIVL